MLEESTFSPNRCLSPVIVVDERCDVSQSAIHNRVYERKGADAAAKRRALILNMILIPMCILGATDLLMLYLSHQFELFVA